MSETEERDSSIEKPELTKQIEMIKEITAREECYERMREMVKETLRDYYQKFPDRVGDARMKDALAHSFFGMDLIFGILDEYDIEFKGGERMSSAPERPPATMCPA